MENRRCHILLLVFALVAAVNSQSYPRFEFRGNVLVNNSYILRPNIGEGHNASLHCVTDNSDCCSNGEGNWYDERKREVHQGPDGPSDRLYVTRGDGWSISIAEKEEEVQECGDVIFLIVMVYSRASTSTLALLTQVFGCVCGGPCV